MRQRVRKKKKVHVFGGVVLVGGWQRNPNTVNDRQKFGKEGQWGRGQGRERGEEYRDGDGEDM